jgi:maleate cis-trans isomerase
MVTPRSDKDFTMPRHFGVLIPSTNTTGEIEYSRLLPESWQPHYARVATSSVNKTPFSPPKDEDVEYQAKLLGTARVEIIFLLQTSASLFADNYCADVSRRIEAASGVPAFTSAMAIGEAMGALGAKRIAIVSPYSEPVNASAKRYYEGKYGLEVVALEGFAATDSYAIGNLGPENAREAFARIDRPEIEAFVVPGGNFPTMGYIAEWEREFNKPVVTTNQAAFWAVLQRLGGGERCPGLGRLLA